MSQSMCVLWWINKAIKLIVHRHFSNIFCFRKTEPVRPHSVQWETGVSTKLEATTDRQKLNAYNCIWQRPQLRSRVPDKQALKTPRAPADQIHVHCSRLHFAERKGLISLLNRLPLFTHISSVCINQSGMTVFTTHVWLILPLSRVLVKLNTIYSKWRILLHYIHLYYPTFL